MIPDFLAKLFGANYKTSLTGIGTAIFSGLTALAALPYTIGDLGNLIPPEYKAKIFSVGLIATVVLRIWNSLLQRTRKSGAE